jgi:crossover junction endodeoxyribonuclease RusA
MEQRMTFIELPWPPKALSPNARVHWAEKARKTKMARTLAWGLTAQLLGTKIRYWEPRDGEIVLKVTLEPPMRGGARPDEDNVMASLKAYRDGIASALGVNDSRFRNERPEWLPKSGAGRVIISF